MTSTISRLDTSDSPLPIKRRFGRSWPAAPRIAAEALTPVPEPLLTGLSVGPEASPAAIVRSIARSLLPIEDSAEPPPWLLPGQHRSFRRVVAAVRRYGGAMLADPVGSGKTYVALAAAAMLVRRGPIACLVPATLTTQWSATAERLGLELEIVSHEQVSRGRLPARARGLVLIDESHHYRNPATRRSAFAASWLVGRPVLLLTATPLVNRLADLSHQLRLGVRDDALIADGIVSLHRCILEGDQITGLARVIIDEPASGNGRPLRLEETSPASADECAAVSESIERIRRLSLSRAPATAALVRGVFLRAAGSSAAALLGALRRYRTLLLHAQDARAAGRPVTRADIRRFAGELEEQLVMWELVGGTQGGLDIALDDLDLLEPIIAETSVAAAARDHKLERLRSLLADGRPSLVFTARTETVRHLRERLAAPVAWCTGERAGVGRVHVPRDTVLSWFRADTVPPAREGPSLPRHLIATDVAAEGLDLQRAGRIVHYDAPWTPMRLEQREGRAVRLGSTHAAVEVVRFLPPPALEAEIHVESALSRKSCLPALAGLGPRAARPWQWRDELAAAIGTARAVAGIGLVRGNGHGVLAGFTLHATLGRQAACLGAVAGFLNREGEWSEDRWTVTRMVSAAARVSEAVSIGDECRRRILRMLAAPIRAHVALAAGCRWAAAEPDPVAKRVAQRLRQAAREAASRRDIGRLAHLESALAFVAGGHTAGEAALVRRLADSSLQDLERTIARLPDPTPRPDAIEARLTGVVLFEE